MNDTPERLPDGELETKPAEDAGVETPPEPVWHKLHPLTPIIDGGLVLVIVVGVIVANMRDLFINAFFGDRWDEDFEIPEEVDGEAFDLWEYMLSDGHWFIALLIVLGIIVLGLGIAWLNWYFHSYQINERAVELKKGVIIKKHRRAPIERIQSVNLQRPLIARIFGLTKIEIQTGGAEGALNLAYLSHTVAKTVRGQILRTASDASTGTAQSAGVIQADSAAHAAGHEAGGLAQDIASEVDRRAKEFVDFDIDAESPESIVQIPHGRLIGSILLSHEAIFVYIAVIAIPIFAATVSWGVLTGLIPAVIAFVGLLISRFNRGFNFSISYSQSGIRTGSGLTSTSTDTIPRHRIHAVDISQPLWWRPFGWWRIRLATAGGFNPSSSNTQKLENVVLPVGKREDVLRVLALIAPTLDTDGDRYWLTDALEGPGTGFTPAGKKSAWVLLFGKSRAGITIAHGDTQEATVRIRRGALTRHLVIMPVVRVQSIMLHRPAVHYWLGLASLQLHTVPGPIMVNVRGLALEDARAWWNYLSATAIRVQQGDQKRHIDE